MIITPTSLTINQLFGSNNEQYVIPTYQRRYSWHERQVWELIEDIKLIEGNDTHLLGSIVCLAGHHTAGIRPVPTLIEENQLVATCGPFRRARIGRKCREQRGFLEQVEAQNL